MKNLFSILLLLCSSIVFAQNNSNTSVELTQQMKEAVVTYNEKVNERIQHYTNQQYKLYKEQRIPMTQNLDQVIQIQMQKGMLYQLCFVGDPLSYKMHLKLFLNGAGLIVQDKVNVLNEGMHWIDVPFLCPATGIYELSLQQKTDIERPLAYMMLFTKTSTN
ncbi:MAG: hypothetical protein R2831_03200 [Chitinophagaceae bacterium]